MPPKKSKQSQQPKRKNWCFTLRSDMQNAAAPENLREMEATVLYGQLLDHCDSFAFQLELGAEDGYYHFQGYMELSIRNRHCWIMNNIRHFSYVAPSKGTPRQGWMYATKSDTRILGPWTYGEPAPDNNRKDLRTYYNAVKSGMTDAQLLEEYPSETLRMQKAIDFVRTTCNVRIPKVKRTDLYGDDIMEVYVFFGGAGKGKSYAARDLYPEIYDLPIQRRGNFFLTRDASLQPVILIEDFDGSLPLKDLNRLLDPYPLYVENKGGHIWWCPKIVILTTNVPPGAWYDYDDRQDVESQIYRRITYCFDFNTDSGRSMTRGMSCEELQLHYPIRKQQKRKKEEADDFIRKYKVAKAEAWFASNPITLHTGNESVTVPYKRTKGKTLLENFFSGGRLDPDYMPTTLPDANPDHYDDNDDMDNVD